METGLSSRDVSKSAPDVAVTSGKLLDTQIRDKFKLDRYITDIITLPHSYDDVRLDYNSSVTDIVINGVIDKLNDNFLYLNAYSKLAVNDMPLDGAWETSIVVDNSDPDQTPTPYNFNYTDNPSNTVALVSATSGISLSGFTDAKFVLNDDDNGIVGFVPVNNGTRLLSLEIPYQSTSPYISSGTTIERFGGTGITTLETATDLSFTNILDLEFTKDKKLFILDSNLIHKLDVTSVLTKQSALTAVGRYLDKSIGGLAESKTSKTRFLSATKLSIDSADNIYVLDVQLNGYKIFDENLNWKKTNVKTSEFKSLTAAGDTFVDIAVNKDNDDVYILSTGGTLKTFDVDSKLVNSTTFTDSVSGEKYKTIRFSQINNNIFYVLTDKNLYKKFVSRPDRSIGAYKTDRILTAPAISGTESFAFVDVVSGIGDRETIFLGSDTLNATHSTGVDTVGKIFIEPYDKTNFKTVTYDFYKTQIIDLSATNIVENEYVSSFVINKGLYKILYNHMILNDHLHSKFSSQYGADGKLLFTGTTYLTDLHTSLINLSANSDYFVGINEPLIADVINRCIWSIYDLQVSIAGVLDTEKSNTYPLPSQTVELS